MSITANKKGEKDGEVELRATGKSGGKSNRLTQLYIGAVDRSRSSSRASEGGAQPRVKSFNRALKADKDEIKKAYHDVRSDNTGFKIYILVNFQILFQCYSILFCLLSNDFSFRH